MMIESFSSPVANALALTLLHFLWQGSLIGLGYWAVLATSGVRSTRIRYATSLLTLSVTALCPLVTFAVVYDLNAAVDEAPTPAVATTSSDRADALADPEVTHRAGAPAAGRRTANEIASEFGEAEGARRGFAVVQSVLEASQPYVLLVWLAGVMLSGARLTAGILNVIWLRSGRTMISTALADRASMLARRLGLKSARIFASTRIREAAVVGFWKPVVLLPASWLTLLPADVLEAVIAHELAHIRRFDVWVNLLQRILETLLFYHPMVWWLSNRIRLEREMCCDELAVRATGERGDYVIALEQVGRLQVQGTMRLAPSFTGDRKMKLLSRIQNVLGTIKQTEREPAWLVGIVAVAIPLLLVVIGGDPTGHNVAVAQEREGGRSAEAEAGPRRAAEGQGKRRSAEAEAGPRRSPEAEAGPRRSAEGERGPRRSAEGQGRRESNEAFRGFKPQTRREAALYQMILQLQREVSLMRREMQGRRGSRDGEAGQRGPRDGESTKRGPRDGESSREVGRRDGELPPLSAGWERTKVGGTFRTYDKNGDRFVSLDEWLAMTNGNISDARRQLQTKRFRETNPGSDDKLSPAEFIYWYAKGRFENVGEGRQRSGRDGESGRSAEGEAGPRRSAEGEGRRSPEAEAGPRRSAEGKVGAKRGSAERAR